MSLLDPIRFPELSPAEAQYRAATMPTGFGEYLGAKLKSGFDFSISGRLSEQVDSHPEGGPLPPGVSPDIASGMMGLNVDQRRVTEDEWRKLKLDRPGLAYSGGGTVEYETARTRAFDERRYRDSIIARYQGGIGGQVVGFGAQMLGGLPSPENFIPFVGPEVRAAMVARMGTIGGHAAASSLDASIGTALADAVVLPDLARRGEDVGAGDFALDLALGAVTGGLLGTGGGLLARRAEGRARTAMLAEAARAVRLDGLERQGDALELSLRALADDQPVEVGPVLAPADAALRRRLMSGVAALPDAAGFDVHGLPEREAMPSLGGEIDAEIEAPARERTGRHPLESLRKRDVGDDYLESALTEAKQQQPFDDLNGLYNVAGEHQSALGAAGDEIAAAIPGVKFKNPGLKERATSEEKLIRKGYDSPRQMTDAIRAGFMVETPEQAEAVIAELAKRFRVLDEGFALTPQGYFDGKVLVQFADGTLGEVQLWEPNVMEAKGKGGGHKLYTEARSLPKGDPRRVELDRQQRDLYSAARAKAGPGWAKLLGRGPADRNSLANTEANVSGDMTRPVWATSSSSTAVQDPRSTANASSLLTSTAGRPSQLVNTGSDIGPTPSSRNIARAAAEREITDYVTREAVAPLHPSIIEAESSVRQAPPKTGVEEAQRLAKDMAVENPPELEDVKVLKRDGLLTAADETELERAAETVKDANGWADAYTTLSTCVLRFGA